MNRWAVFAAGVMLAGTMGSGVACAAEPSRAPDTAGKTYAPNNTGRNAEDRNAGAKTADQQSNDPADVRMTAEIRRALTSDDSLSTSAHNVKIITIGGVVTLRGPVASEDERTRVANMAKQVTGVKRVENHLDVARR